MILRARVVLPVSTTAIEDGAVVVKGNRIADVGRWCDLAPRHKGALLVDLGDSVVLPGLVNAHCHLDYTDLAGFLRPTRFPDWVKGLLVNKAGWSYSEYAQSWLNGARMLVRSGTTTVMDIESIPELLPDVWSATPLRVGSCLELTCVKSRRNVDDIIQEAAESIQYLKPTRGFVGISPHALYSTVPALLTRLVEQCRRENWRVTMHVAESPEEFEMYMDRDGAMFHWLRKQRDMSDCGGRTPTEQVYRCGLLGERFLAAHANYLRAPDVRLLAESGSSVVHCPRSHSFFGYDPFPYEKLVKAGVNVCLGTDSLASVHLYNGHKPELSLFAEMRAFAAKTRNASPETLLRMATVHGARALGMQGQIGELSTGAFADLIVLPYNGSKSEACAAVVNNWRDVSAAMIDGRWAIAP